MFYVSTKDLEKVKFTGAQQIWVSTWSREDQEDETVLMKAVLGPEDLNALLSQLAVCGGPGEVASGRTEKSLTLTLTQREFDQIRRALDTPAKLLQFVTCGTDNAFVKGSRAEELQSVAAGVVLACGKAADIVRAKSQQGLS